MRHSMTDEQMRVTLFELFRNPEYLSDADPTDRMAVITCCAASIIEHELCRMHDCDAEGALEGLSALYADMRINIQRRCSS